MASSDDELAGRAATPPITYEFQSELSDDASSPGALIISDVLPHEPNPEPIDPEPIGLEPIEQPASEPNGEGSDAEYLLEEDAEEMELDTDFLGSTRNGTLEIRVDIPYMAPDKKALYQCVEVSDNETRSWFGPNGLLRYDDGDEFAFEELKRSSSEMSGKRKSRGANPPRKRTRVNFTSSDEGEDEFLDSRSHRDRATRSKSRGTSIEYGDVPETSGRTLRARTTLTQARGTRTEKTNGSIKDDDMDELQQDPEDDRDDDDFVIITSDLQPQRGRPRKGAKRRIVPARDKSARHDSDGEGDGNRRSSRANRVTKSLRDPTGEDDDDDIFYEREEDSQPVTPRILSVKEIFQPCDSPEFKEFHRPVCNICGHTEGKSTLIYCQGCSNSFHKVCLGPRNGRPQRATKVGPDNFVLQCQFCIGKTRLGREVRGPRRPRQDMCQSCHAKGVACAAFSPRHTSKVEERMREENGGEDPSHKVASRLLNKADNLLFRCSRCRRGWHFKHLPHPTQNPDPAKKDPDNLAKHRLKEYSIYWLCMDCYDVQDLKIDKIVAWRPRDKKKHGNRELKLEDFSEDELEYLIKWMNKSYAHCTWKAGAWLYEYAASAMRLSFNRRNFDMEDMTTDEDSHASLLKFSKKEAIPEAYLIPEVILDVEWAPRSKEQEATYKKLSSSGKKDDDFARIFHVLQIYVKYEGLPYNDVVWDSPPSPDSRFYSAFETAYEDFLVGKHFKFEDPKAMRERVQQFRTLDFPKEIQYHGQPEGFNNGKLMNYQIEGLNWMLLNYRNDRSIILADEMGLGKTVQVVAFLRSLVLDKPLVWPFLVVVPNATCQNWRREIKKWAPELRVVLYYGGATPQELSYKYELFPGGSKHMHAHVVVMSYQSASDSTTKSRFSSVKWAGLVVDEAHSLKNDQNNLPKALKALRIPFSLLLTGTPLQNNKRELFTLVSFVSCNIDVAALDEKYSDDNLTEETVHELHEIIRPYFLRRTKTQVLKFLPPMSQIIVPLSMTVLQEKLCKSILEKNPDLIRAIFAKTKVKAGERTGMNNILLQLRKCLCHPFIYSRAIEDRTVAPEVSFRNLIEASSKLLLLEIMLPKLQARGHRVLIFSQFLGQLDILEDFMIGIGLKYQRIDGEIGSLEKQNRIDQFNAESSTLFAMLLSTRAGGVGINLATADTVIILDPDWNPHQDIQALSRAHRIGQTKKVLCFQFVTQSTAEERIMQIGRKKMAMDHVLIETMDNKKGEETNVADIESALRYGAAALFGEDQKKEVIKYDSAAVDKLLDRADEEEVKVEEENPAESLFKNAKVWANDAADLKANEEGEEKTVSLSVWDEIIRQREEEARLEQEHNQQILGRGGRRRHAANYRMDDGEGKEDGEGTLDEDFVGPASDPDSTDTDNGDGEFGANGHRKGKGPQDISGTQTPQQNGTHTPNPRPQAPVPKSERSSKAATPSAATVEPVKRRRGRPPRGSTPGQIMRPGDPSIVPGPGGASIARPGGGASAVQVGRPLGMPAYAQSGRPIIPGQSRPSTLTPSQLAQHYVSAGLGDDTALSYAAIALLGGQIPALKNLQKNLQAGQAANLAQAMPPRPLTHQPRTSQQLPVINTPASVAWKHSNPSPQPSRPAQPPPPQNKNVAQISGAGPSRQETCFVCCFQHPPEWACPEMSDKVQLRLALDSLKTAPSLNPQQRQQRKVFLMDRLVSLNKAHAE